MHLERARECVQQHPNSKKFNLQIGTQGKTHIIQFNFQQPAPRTDCRSVVEQKITRQISYLSRRSISFDDRKSRVLVPYIFRNCGVIPFTMHHMLFRVLNSSHTVAYNPNARRAYGNSQLDV